MPADGINILKLGLDNVQIGRNIGRYCVGFARPGNACERAPHAHARLGSHRALI